MPFLQFHAEGCAWHVQRLLLAFQVKLFGLLAGEGKEQNQRQSSFNSPIH